MCIQRRNENIVNCYELCVLDYMFAMSRFRVMLQKLRLTTMRLEHIEDGAFCYLRQVSLLNLNQNQLQSLPELCALTCCLVTLSLSHNNISNIRKNAFEGYQILEELYLSYNKLLVLPDMHWIRHSLRGIQANGNKIESLDVFETSGVFKSLSYIDMGLNRIRIFNITILHHVPKLRYLILRGNELTTIDDFRIYYKKNIRLAGNPWHCGTSLSWMGEDDMPFENGLVCETPACKQGIAISDMSKYNKSAVLINRFLIVLIKPNLSMNSYTSKRLLET